jgi:hypothetical protein
MKAFAAGLLMFVLAAPALASSRHDEEAVIEAMHAGCEAFRTGNVWAAAEFLGYGFTLTDSSGNVTNREQTLIEIRNREPFYEVFRNHHMKVRIYGNTAVVNGITTLKGTSGGQPFAADLQFTDTLVRIGGKWRMVATHVSPVATPAAGD